MGHGVEGQLPRTYTQDYHQPFTQRLDDPTFEHLLRQQPPLRGVIAVAKAIRAEPSVETLTRQSSAFGPLPSAFCYITSSDELRSSP